MKIALIGYGAMGRLIERLSLEAEHSVVATVSHEDAGLTSDELAAKIRGADAAIDFTTADAVSRNVKACLAAGVPLVEGTTGWNAEKVKLEQLVTEADGAMVYGANFSIGVNLFYRIADHAAELFSKFPEYEVFIEEQHHSRKKDAPSGTALKLKDVVSKHLGNEFSVSATRAGNIPGTHRVGFDGPADQILLEHSARSREGFARGALFAAEWIVGKKGFYDFSEIFDDVLKR